MRKFPPTTIALIAAGLLILVLLILLVVRGGGDNQDRLSDSDARGDAQAVEASDACAERATYDEIKRELFRQAAATRGRDADTYDRLSAYANLAVDRPRLVGEKAEIGAVRCKARISLSVPPNVVAVGGRRNFSADATYLVQPASDGSGPAITLTDVESITIPLATLSKSSDSAPAPQPEPVPIPATDPLAPDPDPEPQSIQSTTSPSFDCRNAKTRGELAVCSSGQLAALDRQMAAQYVAAGRAATARSASFCKSRATGSWPIATRARATAASPTPIAGG